METEGNEIAPTINNERNLYPMGGVGETSSPGVQVDQDKADKCSPRISLPSSTSTEDRGNQVQKDRENKASSPASRTLVPVLGGVIILLLLVSTTLLCSFQKTSKATLAELEQMQEKVDMLQEMWEDTIQEQDQRTQLQTQGVEKEVTQLSNDMMMLQAHMQRVIELGEAGPALLTTDSNPL
eukprot:gene13451-19309_t